ncbi:MAG: hypothetical protein M1531_09140 [Chloroflexi bacterium]|nr:hypothetical protein [Chloroflexota bacterium]
MTAGRPDYTSSTVIRGLSPTSTLIPVALDANGNLVALVQGSDGATLHTIRVDASGQLIMVPRGQSGNYMSVDTNGYLTSVMKGNHAGTSVTLAVDANGNILGVLQGDYAGALKTLAVDSQGRMLAVLTDPEDVFGNPNYMGGAELAVRLGSISKYNRLGQVYWDESFEYGLQRVVTATSGAGSSVTQSNLASRSGAYAAKLTVGATVGNYARVSAQLQPPPLGKWGIECSFTTYFHLYPLTFLISYRNGTINIIGEIQYDFNAQTLKYRNSDGTYTTLASNIILYSQIPLFHTIKLIVDMTTQQYVRVLLNGNTYDMAGIGMHAPGDVGASWVTLEITSVQGAGGSVDTNYIDDLIFTANEPR